MTVGYLRRPKNPSDCNKTSSIVEDLQEWTNTRLPDLKALIKVLKDLSFEVVESSQSRERIIDPQTPEHLHQMSFISNNIHWRSVIWEFPSGWWSMLNDSTLEETYRFRQRIWLDVIEDPSPPVLVVKWFSAAMLGLAIYHDHLDDRYQGYFLVAGFACGAIIANNFSQNLMSGIQTYLPFCVILALCWSAMLHRLGRAINRIRSRREEARLAWGK